jgi:hypothetical protein
MFGYVWMKAVIHMESCILEAMREADILAWDTTAILFQNRIQQNRTAHNLSMACLIEVYLISSPLIKCVCGYEEVKAGAWVSG